MDSFRIDWTDFCIHVQSAPQQKQCEISFRGLSAWGAGTVPLQWNGFIFHNMYVNRKLIYSFSDDRWLIQLELLEKYANLELYLFLKTWCAAYHFIPHRSGGLLHFILPEIDPYITRHFLLLSYGSYFLLLTAKIITRLKTMHDCYIMFLDPMVQLFGPKGRVSILTGVAFWAWAEKAKANRVEDTNK